MTATILGDTQLWTTTLNGWVIPLFAVPVSLEGGTNAWDIRAAVMLNVPEHTALVAKLGPSCLFESAAGWVMAEEVFHAFATKAAGITPAYYHRREQDAVTHKFTEVDVKEPEFDPARDLGRKPAATFPEFVWRETGGDLVLFRFYWNIFSKHVAQWLVAEMGEIDLGWLKLRALPVRDNWKQILLAKFPDLAAADDMAPGELETFLNSPPFLRHGYFVTDMIKLSGEKHNRLVGWTPEIETTKEWEAYARDIELSRVRSLRGELYPKWWGSIMKALKPYAMSVLVRFASQTNLPAAAVGSVSNVRTTGFVEHVDDTGIKPVRVDDVVVRVGGNHGRLAVWSASGNKAVPLSSADLQEMPTVRLSPPKVRGPKPNMARR